MTATPMPAEPIPPATPAPAPAQPTTVPAHAVHHLPPRPPMTDVVFGPKVITLMVFIGVIILLIGAALASQAAVTKTVDNDIDTVNDYREESYSQYKNGITMMVVGNMLMVLFLLGGALNCKDIQSYVKVGMFIFSGLLIICSVWLVIAYPGPMLMTGPTILD